MAEHLVVERGFWARLFLGRLRLEHHPEVLKVVVQRKGSEQVISYSELKSFVVYGRTCRMGLDSQVVQATWLPPTELALFGRAVSAGLIEYHREACRPALEAALAYRTHYVRDREWPQCAQVMATLRQSLELCRSHGVDPLQGQPFSTEEIAFLSQVSTLTDEDKLRQLVRDHAERVLLTQHTAFLDQVEKYPLNAEQRLAVVRTNDRNLILAAAGTGKTSVIVAKALYLLQSGAALPEDILIMAYNKAAAEELKERLNACAERAGIDGSNVQASTFHALGRSVLVDCDCAARVSVLATDEHAFSDWLNRWLFSYLTVDPARIQQFINLFMGSVLFDQVLKEHTLQSEHTEAKEQEALLQAPPELYRTLNNEKVKSRQEVHIANWLATHGVPYHYEERYVTKLRLVPDFDYKPDFHIIRPRAAGSAPDDEPPIYLEHYGIDREGNTKPSIDRDAYNALIERKRQVHKENGTILLETFSYEFSEKTIDDRLEELMKSVGIPLRPVSPEELLQKIKGNKGFGELNELLERCVQVIREFNYSRNDLLQRYQDAGLRYATDYADFFAQLVSDYQAYLNERGEIDFCDMIVRASELVAEGSFSRSWRYILVDEFQDISLSRLQLLQGLLKCNPKCVLTCVGDDWQAIYHFAGGILDATVHFDHYFCSYTLTKLVQTYRYPPSIAATAGTFVQENPQQFRKDVVSLQEDSGVKVHLLDAKEMGALTVSSLFCHKLRGLNYVHSAITSAIAALYQVQVILKQHPDATVAVISRYNKVLVGIASYLEHISDFPANALLSQDPPLELTEDESRAAERLQLDPALFSPRDKKRKEQLKAQIKLWTMHKAKGLEADYIILAGFYGGDFLSFPCRIKDSEILACLLDNNEDFKDAEERRLFYVTLTRAKHDAYLICDTSMPVSSFAAELLHPKYRIDLQVKSFKENYLRQYGCKVCNSGTYQLIQGQFGPYYACTNPACPSKPRICAKCGAPSVDQKGYSECTNPQCGERIPLCERCGRPLKLREGRYGQFYGCSGYGLPDDACTFTKNYEAIQRLLQHK